MQSIVSTPEENVSPLPRLSERGVISLTERDSSVTSTVCVPVGSVILAVVPAELANTVTRESVSGVPAVAAPSPDSHVLSDA